jgi:hypothetical protein
MRRGVAQQIVGVPFERAAAVYRSILARANQPNLHLRGSLLATRQCEAEAIIEELALQDALS